VKIVLLAHIAPFIEGTATYNYGPYTGQLRESIAVAGFPVFIKLCFEAGELC
jgi:hypothetical protein